MPINNTNLIWIDLEMTGLDPDRDRIIEIATLVTNSNLAILAEGPVIAIHQPNTQLSLMNEWNIRTHTDSGLINRVRHSQLNENATVSKVLNFLHQWVPPKQSLICGNSIGYDRMFLLKYMPDLEAYFHYRYLDVSTIKELVRLWKPEILSGVTKKNTHQALNDIRESVAELAYYRKYFMHI